MASVNEHWTDQEAPQGVTVRPSVDWVTVGHRYLAPVRVFNGGQVVSVSPSGEFEWSRDRHRQVRGSWSSSAALRCDGSVAEISFNPSRWAHQHSLVGCGDGASVWAVIGSVLSLLECSGFPSLRDSQRRVVHVRKPSGGEQTLVYGVHQLSRVDVCCTYAAGSPEDAAALLSDYSRMRLGTARPVVYDGTVCWSWKDSARHVKFYDKGAELRRHARGCESLHRLADYLGSVGALRHEVTLRGRDLRARRADYLSYWSAARMAALLAEFSMPKVERLKDADAVTLKASFLALGDPPSKADRLTAMAVAYRVGGLPPGMSASTLKRLRRDLLRVGIDISVAVPAMRANKGRPAIELKPLVIPADLLAPCSDSGCPAHGAEVRTVADRRRQA